MYACQKKKKSANSSWDDFLFSKTTPGEQNSLSGSVETIMHHEGDAPEVTHDRLVNTVPGNWFNRKKTLLKTGSRVKLSWSGYVRGAIARLLRACRL